MELEIGRRSSRGRIAMKHFLFTFFAAASLLMFVPITVIWVRSYWIADSILLKWWNVAAQKKLVLELDFSRGGMRAGYDCQRFTDRADFAAEVWGDRNDGLPTAEWEAPVALEYPTLGGGFQKKTTLGFGFSHDSTGLGNASYEFVFPPGILAGLLAVLPACWLIGARRAWRDGKREVGHCSLCGYDLRASKEICPECGSPVSQTLITEAPLRRQRRQVWRAAVWGAVMAVVLAGIAAFGALHHWNVQREAYEQQQSYIVLGVALLGAVDTDGDPDHPADIGKIRGLLDAGADPRFVIGSDAGPWELLGPPLCVPASRGDLEAVKLLLSRGADINGRGVENTTPLVCAANCEHLEIVRHLLAHGADPNMVDRDGNSPLTKALGRLRQEEDPTVINQIADVLISGGANINAHNDGGASPLLLATMARDWELAKKLIELGADVNAADGDGQTALLAAQSEPFDKIDAGKARAIVALLVGHGANVNVRKPDGCSALLNAVCMDDLETAKLFIAHGADVNVADNQSQTPLFMARYLENAQMVQLLVQNGAGK